MNILLVDDNQDILETLYEFLSLQGHTIFDFDNAVSALKHLNTTTHPVHLILSDINMPVLNGVEFTKFIRNQGNNTPVIFMTGYFCKELENAVHKLNTTILYKPINFASLEVLINAI